jgi:hypothetical protein
MAESLDQMHSALAAPGKVSKAVHGNASVPLALFVGESKLTITYDPSPLNIAPRSTGTEGGSTALTTRTLLLPAYATAYSTADTPDNVTEMLKLVAAPAVR